MVRIISTSKNDPSLSEYSLKDLKIRHNLLRLIRNIFDKNDFLEVITQTLTQTPAAEAYLETFETIHFGSSLGKRYLHLRTSPELAHKKLILQGIDKLFEIGSCYRNNNEFGDWHRPEFSMLEFYDTTKSFMHFQKWILELLNQCFKEFSPIKPQTMLHMSLFEFIENEFQIKNSHTYDQEFFKQISKKISSDLSSNDTDSDVFSKFLILKVEPALRKYHLVCLHGYPEFQFCLAKSKNGISRRFEVYFKGVELANGFDEENDPLKIKLTFEKINEVRSELKKPLIALPEYLLEHKTKDFVGCAIGFDRLFLLLLGRFHRGYNQSS